MYCIISVLKLTIVGVTPVPTAGAAFKFCVKVFPGFDTIGLLFNTSKIIVLK